MSYDSYLLLLISLLALGLAAWALARTYAHGGILNLVSATASDAIRTATRANATASTAKGASDAMAAMMTQPQPVPEPPPAPVEIQPAPVVAQDPAPQPVDPTPSASPNDADRFVAAIEANTASTETNTAKVALLHSTLLEVKALATAAPDPTPAAAG